MSFLPLPPASMATLGASSSWVVSAGTSSARTVSKTTPEARPAAASASASAGSNSSEPAGISPADALVKGTSATSPSTSSRSRSRIARTSPTPRSVIAYAATSSPSARPPASAFGSVIGVVRGANVGSSGISNTSAPQRSPWLHAPGGAYSWVIRSETSWPALSVV